MVNTNIQNEKTPFHPRSPYAVSKLFAYWTCINYRESYNIFATNGIMFNHESPRRGETFITRKITMAASKIALGLQKKLYLGNLSVKRDWGHAKDYVEGMYKALQHKEPDEFVFATGKSVSVREFCKLAFKEVGIDIEFQGFGVDEKGINAKTGEAIIEVDPKYFRPAEVDFLCGDSSKAKLLLNWEPTYNLETLIKEMVQEDMKAAKKSTERKLINE